MASVGEPQEWRVCESRRNGGCGRVAYAVGVGGATLRREVSPSRWRIAAGGMASMKACTLQPLGPVPSSLARAHMMFVSSCAAPAPPSGVSRE